MKAEERAAQALSKHYDGTFAAVPPAKVPYHMPGLHSLLTREIEAAEERGRAAGTRTLNVTMDLRALVLHAPIPKELVEFETAHQAAAEAFGRQVIREETDKLDQKITGHVFEPCRLKSAEMRAMQGKPITLPPAPVQLLDAGTPSAVHVPHEMLMPPEDFRRFAGITDAHAVPDRVPLFVYFDEQDEDGGAADLRITPTEDVAEHLAKSFCVQRPCGVGFRDGTGNNLQVVMRDPVRNAVVVDYVRNALEEIVHTVVAERDVAWSVALAEAGFDQAPLTPALVANAVRYHDADTRRNLLAHLDATAEQHAAKIKELEDAAFEKGRLAERQACIEDANKVGFEERWAYYDRALGGRKHKHRADGAADVRAEIIRRAEAEASPVTQGDCRGA